MLYFASDYQETAHETILQRFLETAGEHMTGYGSDKYCASAQEKIRVACACPQAEVRFLSRIKQHGALLAKGWSVGLQFDALFTDGLYEELGAHAIEMAEKMKAGLLEKGYELYLNSPTNQQFLTADDGMLAKLEGEVVYSFWEKLPDGRTVIRFATSWATKPEDVDALLAFL